MFILNVSDFWDLNDWPRYVVVVVGVCVVGEGFFYEKITYMRLDMTFALTADSAKRKKSHIHHCQEDCNVIFLTMVNGSG